MKKLCCIVGARPNFMKIAPIMRQLAQKGNNIETVLVHTGQHYDEAMNSLFFQELDIPKPDVHLDVGSSSHAIQTAEIMKRFEPVLEKESPQAILVVGDVNSTIACSLVAAKKGTKIIHVEAGLRSFDRTMPEEINRILTDQLSDVLFITEQKAENNLRAEGISSDKIHFVGNVMIDTLFYNLMKTERDSIIFHKHNIVLPSGYKNYGILTLHRPSNVDDPNILQNLLETLSLVSEKLPLIFPVHPRTAQRIRNAKLNKLLERDTFITLEPIGYLELLGLMRNAKLVLTDSGGIQEETTALGVPCLTLRENTERPITLTDGTNTLVGRERKKIMSTVDRILKNGGKTGKIPKAWDGRAAERIVDIINDWI